MTCNTVRRALRREGPPQYRRPLRPSKLDPFKDEIHRLLREYPRIPGKRVRELIVELGFTGSKTIVDDYLREVRPLFECRRTYQRMIYDPGELCQFDLFEPRCEIPVGYGQTRRAWMVTAELGYSRALAGARWSSRRRRPICCSG
jgi:transposase